MDAPIVSCMATSTLRAALAPICPRQRRGLLAILFRLSIRAYGRAAPIPVPRSALSRSRQRILSEVGLKGTELYSILGMLRLTRFCQRCAPTET
jgi:hypothetical protein